MHHYDIHTNGVSLQAAQKAMVLLHGRGATAASILSLADEFIDDSFYVAAAQATLNTWYPYSFMAPTNQNEPWLTSAIDTVTRLLNEIEQHLSSDSIFIMGFSQGACLTLEVAARRAKRYAGIAAFTGGLIGDTLDHSKYTKGFDGTPVYIGNGDHDPHVPLSRSEESKSIFEKNGAKASLHVFPGRPHTILDEEISIVKSKMFLD